MIKTYKPQKRTITVCGKNYFLDFPKIIQNGNYYCMEANNELYYLPVPNSDIVTKICLGDGNDLWSTEFTTSNMDIMGYYVRLNTFEYFESIKEMAKDESLNDNFRRLLLDNFFVKWEKEGFDALKLVPVPKQLRVIYNNDLSEKELIEIVEYHPFLIQFIENPSEEMQLTAINKDLTAKWLIKNPTAKVEQVWRDTLSNSNPGKLIEVLAKMVGIR